MKSVFTATLIALSLTTLSTTMPAQAQAPHSHNHATTATTTPAASQRELTNAEVRRVDKNAKKITLKHEAIKSLDMPGMTMVFQVTDAAMLEKLQVGDKIKFAAKQEGNNYIVTEIVTDK